MRSYRSTRNSTLYKPVICGAV